MIELSINDEVEVRHAADNAELRARLRGFVATNFYVTDPSTLRDEDSLLDTGVIDSTGVLEVISYLEREFEIQVADEEIVPENLDSIERLAAYVQRKRSS